MKVKCEIILLDVSVQHDDRIDTYWLITVSILYIYRYRPSPIVQAVVYVGLSRRQHEYIVYDVAASKYYFVDRVR